MKTKRTNLLLGLILISLFSYSCSIWGDCIEGEGPITKKILDIDHFSKIKLSSSVKVIVRQGDVHSVGIKAQANLIPLLKTEVTGDEWEIQFDKCIKPGKQIEIHITVLSLEELGINGSGEIESDGVLQSDKLELDINGSGEINLELEVKELESEINGSGDIKLKGTTKTHEIEVRGSGDVDAYELVSDEVDVDINGSGDVKVNVSYSLKVDINGSGDVYYKGNVKEISSDINGSGNLNQSK